MLHYCRLAKKATCKDVVLLPKYSGYFCVVEVVEVIWKMVCIIFDNQLGKFIKLNNVIHSFRANRGTGTASLEAKILQHLTSMREEVLYNIFLYLHKVMMPWTGISDWRSCRGKALDHRTCCFYANSGTIWLWYQGQVGNTAQLLWGTMDSIKATNY